MNLITLDKISKSYSEKVLLDNVTLNINEGDKIGLIGLNGAGKSTLLKIVAGRDEFFSGDVTKSKDLRIEYLSQNTEYEDDTTVLEQVFHGDNMEMKLLKEYELLLESINNSEFSEELNNKLIALQAKIDNLNLWSLESEAKTILTKLGIHNYNVKMSTLSGGQKKRVFLASALISPCDLLILDEPTAVLTPQEIQELIQIIRNLTKEGKSVIIITHKLKEIKAAADHCTIIRRGKYIDTVKVSDTTEDELAAMMVGREVNFKVDKKEARPTSNVLEIKDLLVKDSRKVSVVDGLSLEVKAGEILGIAGIDGNGQSELVEVLTGLRKAESGSIKVNSKELINKKPKEIFDNGIKNIPEDRHKRGLILDFTVAENTVLQNYKDPRFSKNGILNKDAIEKYADEIIERFDVRPTDHTVKSRALSGGNQQKIIIGREVDNIETARKATGEPQLLIATQPTRGLDVGAIEFVHQALVKQRDEGNAVLLVSLELDEVMNVSDRIAVIYEGKIVGIVDAKDADENTLGLMMAGGEDNE
mgnify:CR=1 FL=1